MLKCYPLGSKRTVRHPQAGRTFLEQARFRLLHVPPPAGNPFLKSTPLPVAAEPFMTRRGDESIKSRVDSGSLGRTGLAGYRHLSARNWAAILRENLGHLYSP
jgi:hypothetical protein